MKSRDLFKDIFTLAVRLLGLVFLYLGLSAVTPLLDFGAIETAAKSDLITAILPIVFNLAVAWWLLGGGRVDTPGLPGDAGDFLCFSGTKRRRRCQRPRPLRSNERRTWRPPTKSSRLWWRSRRTTARPDASDWFFK